MHPSACIVSQRYYDPKGQSRIPAGATYTGHIDSGTGVYIGDRLVLTASHVPDRDTGATTYVDFNSQRIRGRVVRRDKVFDLAVVQLQSIPRGVSPVSLANDDVKIGDRVSQSGKTTGLTSGKVSGFSSPPGGGTEWFIVDAAAKSGDSGGPVLMNGRLVGIRWGGDISGSRATQCSVIRRFLRGLLRPQSPSRSPKVMLSPVPPIRGKQGPAGPKGETGAPGPQGFAGEPSETDRELRLAVQANASAISAITRQIEIIAKGQKGLSLKIQETQITSQDIIVLVQRNAKAIANVNPANQPDISKLIERINQLEKKIPASYEIVAGRPKQGDR